ncbi:hypothetical protein GWI33_012471 [Rhynchophorus ferrugineus]|uniref:Uncharacterized protein n=1 Tax=Rhynchophorus ferrugineus TaxID=354439 RepID=A0A834I5G1_RHYFE|nr:hypothetical protein GWI33_012471 [Rhynchophorus ferrugineus]
MVGRRKTFPICVSGYLTESATKATHSTTPTVLQTNLSNQNVTIDTGGFIRRIPHSVCRKAPFGVDGDDEDGPDEGLVKRSPGSIVSISDDPQRETRIRKKIVCKLAFISVFERRVVVLYRAERDRDYHIGVVAGELLWKTAERSATAPIPANLYLMVRL